MKKMINFIIFTILFLSLSAQQKEIQGRVFGHKLERSIEGVLIRSKTNGQYTRSDTAGKFRIETSIADTLIFSRVGYDDEILPVSQIINDFLNVIMKENNNVVMDEVTVHTGYQSFSNIKATGSFVHITNEKLNRATGTNILNRLKGMAGSMYFDSDPSRPGITIRGMGSLTKSSQVSGPLIVLDNFPYEGNIDNINPDNIESITLLRDAAASSIWGAKAGNGVIVITSKNAVYNQPVKLSINANTNFIAKPDLFKAPSLSASDFIDVEKFLFEKGFYSADLSNTSSRPVISPVVEILDKERSGILTSLLAKDMIDSLRVKDVRNDLLKYFYRTGIQQQYALNLSGGKENISYLTTLGLDNSQSNLAGNNDERITWSSTLNIKPIQKLTLRFDMYNTWVTIKSNSPLPLRLASSRDLYPYAQLLDGNNYPSVLPKDFRQAFKDTAGGGNLLDWNYRPIEELKIADDETKRNSRILNFDIKYAVNKYLNAAIKYQFQNEEGSNKNLHSVESYYTRNLINLFSSVAGNNVVRAIPLGSILGRAQSKITSHAARMQIDYNRTINDKHAINVIVGSEIRQSKAINFANRTYGYNDDILTFSGVNYVTQYPGFSGLPSSLTIPNGTSFSDRLNRIVSVYGNASYTYDTRYNLSFSSRKDASNILGVSTNNKWKPLWSGGIAWIVSNEKFYQSLLVPYLKLRFTHGYSGNVNNTISALTTLNYTSINRTGISPLPYAMVVSAPNSDLRWEKIGITNMAIDFASRNHSLSGSIEYYVKKSTDVISGVPADITIYGQPFLIRNVASLKGKGIDLSLNATILNQKIKWKSSLLYSYNKVAVTKYFLPGDPKSYVGEGRSIVALEGENPFNVISYKWNGLNPVNGNPIGSLNKSPSENYSSIINEATWDDLVIHGSAIPLSYGSFLNTLSYRQFSLSFNIIYKLNYYFRKNTINYTNLFGSWIGHADYEKRWQKAGDEKTTNVPSLIYPSNYHRDLFYQRSEVTVLRADHVRLQDIRLDYEFHCPRKIKAPIMHFYCYASNLGLIWKANKENLDPDAIGDMPVPVNFSIGFRIELK